MRAKLFMNGRSQAVRLPAAFRFEGKEVEIERDAETGAVVLRAIRPSAAAWLELRDAALREVSLSREIKQGFDQLRDAGPASERNWP